MFIDFITHLYELYFIFYKFLSEYSFSYLINKCKDDKNNTLDIYQFWISYIFTCFIKCLKTFFQIPVKMAYLGPISILNKCLES